jgi:hypothetical protein
MEALVMLAAGHPRKPPFVSIARKRNPSMSTSPPEGLPVYRLLTGKDDAEFCRRVSEAIAMGDRKSVG